MTFTRRGDAWVANFANRQLPALEGSLTGNELTLKYDEAAKHASSTITLDDSGRSFSGPYSFGEGQRNFVNTRWKVGGPIGTHARARRANSRPLADHTGAHGDRADRRQGQGASTRGTAP